MKKHRKNDALLSFNIAIENGPFSSLIYHDLPMKPVIFHGYLIVVYQRVEYFQDGTDHFQVSNVSASGGWRIPRSEIGIF